jgi:hypothetical protein
MTNARISQARTAAAFLALGSAFVLAPTAQASFAAPARTTVTIQAEGTDLSGEVRSPRRSCRGERTVIVFRQVGTRGGGDDERFASDTSQLIDGVGRWSTGNTGTPGRFYAKVRATSLCAAALSPTVRAQ